MPDQEAIARNILSILEHAWNAGDGDAFAVPFTENADFVDIRGQYHRGQESIGKGHDGIFQSIYKGSHLMYRLKHARALADGLILVHSTGHLEVPAGPLAGTHQAMQSLVLVREGTAWKIDSFHNTTVTPPR